MINITTYLIAYLVCSVLSDHSASKGQDALTDDESDAEAYDRYMAITEASAPLMRFRHHQHKVQQPFRMRNNSPLSSALLTPVEKNWGHQPPQMQSVVYQWSSWSTWSSCSRTCDGGIMSRHRSCRREYIRISLGSGIRSSYQRCIGESTEYSLCNQNKCPNSSQDFRHYQCGLYNNRTVAGFHVTSWIPNSAGHHQCELNCLAGGLKFSYTFGKVLDGTRCTLNPSRPDSDFCINGRCLPVGCDGRIGSYRKRDMCNVCGGKNDTCTHVAAIAFPTPTWDTYSETVEYSAVVRIPRGATNVRMTDNSTNYLALMDDQYQYILNGNRVIDWPGTFESSGDQFNYSRSKDYESISSAGPLLKDIIVTVLVRDKSRGFFYEYWFPNESHSRVPHTNITNESNSHVVRLTTESSLIRSSKNMLTVAPTEATTTSVATTTTRSYLADMGQYEPQPTAASLVRSPPRASYRNILASEDNLDPQLLKKTTYAVEKPPAKKHETTGAFQPFKNEPDNSKQSTKNANADKKTTNPKMERNKKERKKDKSSKSCKPKAPCWKSVNGKKHFCKSEFVLRCHILSYEIVNNEIRYEVQVVQSYKNVIPILNREFIWVKPLYCPCPILKVGAAYIIMGVTDRSFRRNEIRLLLNHDSYVRVFNQMNSERVLRIRRNEANYCKKYKRNGRRNR